MGETATDLFNIAFFKKTKFIRSAATMISNFKPFQVKNKVGGRDIPYIPMNQNSK